MFDLPRIQNETFVEQVVYRPEIGSTNDLALELCAQDDILPPTLVLTACQMDGRGRGANRWWAGPGALTCSLILTTPTHRYPSSRRSQVSLASALAICETVSEFLPTTAVGLKWPNDVQISGRKVSGILVEVPPRCSERLVLGVGLNVNNTFEQAPREVQPLATSLTESTGLVYDLTEVLIRLLHRTWAELALLEAGDDSLPLRWQALCVLRGKTVQLAAGSQTHSGLCDGIDRDGALLLRTESGPRRFFSGIITAVER